MSLDPYSPASRLEQRAARLALEASALRCALREAQSQRDYAVKNLLILSGVCVALAVGFFIMAAVLVLA